MKKKTLAAVLIAVGLLMTACGNESEEQVSSPIQTLEPKPMETETPASSEEAAEEKEEVVEENHDDDVERTFGFVLSWRKTTYLHSPRSSFSSMPE